MENIKDKIYNGTWTIMNKQEEFMGMNNSGKLLMKVHPKAYDRTKSAISNLLNFRILFIIMSEKYLDRIVYVMMDVNYPQNIDYNNESSYIIGSNITSTYLVMNKFKSERMNMTSSKLKLQKDTNPSINDSEKTVTGYLEFDNGTAPIGFALEKSTNEFFKIHLDKVKNFATVLNAIGILHLIHSIFIVRKLEMEPNFSLKLSLFMFCLDVVWNSVICVGCSYLSFYQNTLFDNKLVLPAIIYFVNVSCFELRIVFYILRNNFLVNLDDPIMVRKIVFRFYVVFCNEITNVDVVVYLTAMFSYEVIFMKPLLLLIVAITWLPQIARYAQFGHGTVNLFSVLVISLNKLFIPLYVWRCPSNFLQLSPDTLIGDILIYLMLLQVLLLVWQIVCGGRAFIPKFLRNNPYNYYRTLDELLKEDKNVESQTCPICLGAIGNVLTESDLNYNEGACRRCFTRISIKMNSCLKSCYENENSKPFMITPCNHIFHSTCLSSWLETSLICPICRKPVPVKE